MFCFKKIPVTKDSILAKRIREVLTQVPGPKGTSVKVIEKPGPALMMGLATNNPFKRDTCDRPTCPYRTLGTPCREKCYKEGVVYGSMCLICDQSGVHSLYVGETSRTLHTRAIQHNKDCSRVQKAGSGVDLEPGSSWMMDHVWETHPDLDREVDPITDFGFSVLSTHRDPLSRQTTEAVRIQEALEYGSHTGPKGSIPVSSLNRKGEYFSARERWTRR